MNQRLFQLTLHFVTGATLACCIPAAHAAPRSEEEEPFSVVIPVLYEDEDGEAALVADLNEYLPAAKKFPAFIEVKTADEANEAWGKLGARFDDIKWDEVAPDAPSGDWSFINYSSSLTEFVQDYQIPGSRKKTSLCYKGENPEAALKIPGFIQGLADSVLSDGFYLSGWKYKSQSEIDDSYTEDPAAGNEFPKIWKEWRGRGEAVLIMYSNMYVDDWNFDADAVRKCR
jgi:hypothetical protein